MRRYLVDANFFIQAHRAIYPLDVATSFWLKIKELCESGILISIDKVKIEIYKNEDDLKKWCDTNLPKNFFKKTDIAITEYSQLAVWANSKSDHYKREAIDEFLDADIADAWLIAFAKNKNIPLITYEKSEPNSKRRIKIPDVCIEFNVNYLNTIEMLRQLGERF